MNLPPPPPPPIGSPSSPSNRPILLVLRVHGTWFGVFFLSVFIDSVLQYNFDVPWNNDVSLVVGVVISTLAAVVTAKGKK